jgi:hypothetical protein
VGGRRGSACRRGRTLRYLVGRKIKAHLTAIGGRLLSSVRQIRLAAQGGSTPTGQPAIAAMTGLTVR